MSTTFITKKLKAYLLNPQSIPSVESFARVEMIEKQTHYESSCLYIGDGSSFKFAKSDIIDPNTVFLMGNATEIPARTNQRKMHVLFFKCSPNTIFNELPISQLLNANPISSESSNAENTDDALKENADCAKVYSDIINRKLVSDLEIRGELDSLSKQIFPYVGQAIISFDNPEYVPLVIVATKISKLIPELFVFPFKKDIIVLFSHCYEPFEDTFEPTIFAGKAKDELMSILDFYDGYIVFSNTTSKLNDIRTNYNIAKQTLSLAKKIRVDKRERFFLQEDYSMYYLIDLAVQRYLEIDGNQDIMYMAHPSIVLLTKYDNNNGTNLRDTLYYYLVNDCNITKAAEVLFMHKNTVINKLKKIKSLVAIDTDNILNKQRLIYSCQLLRYYEVALKETVR